MENDVQTDCVQTKIPKVREGWMCEKDRVQSLSKMQERFLLFEKVSEKGLGGAQILLHPVNSV